MAQDYAIKEARSLSRTFISWILKNSELSPTNFLPSFYTLLTSACIIIEYFV